MITIPLKDGTEYIPDKAFISELQSVYEEMDIEFHLKRMRAWCLANPSKRKTRRGIKRFINAWLSRNETHQQIQSTGEQYTAAGDAIFGPGEQADYVDMGKVWSSVQHDMDEQNPRLKNQCRHESRMGGQIESVSCGPCYDGGRILDGEISSEHPRTSGSAKAEEGDAPELPLFAKAESE